MAKSDDNKRTYIEIGGDAIKQLERLAKENRVSVTKFMTAMTEWFLYQDPPFISAVLRSDESATDQLARLWFAKLSLVLQKAEAAPYRVDEATRIMTSMAKLLHRMAVEHERTIEANKPKSRSN